VIDFFFLRWEVLLSIKSLRDSCQEQRGGKMGLDQIRWGRIRFGLGLLILWTDTDRNNACMANFCCGRAASGTAEKPKATGGEGGRRVFVVGAGGGSHDLARRCGGLSLPTNTILFDSFENLPCREFDQCTCIN
jgi:hypothetical protein